MQRLPRVRLQLLQAKTDAPLGRIYIEHNRLDLVADADDLRGMLHALRPRHLADVHQGFDSLFQLDERAVIGHADDPPAHMSSDGVALGGVQPGIVWMWL